MNGFLLQHCVHWFDYGLPLRLHLSNQMHEPCIQSSKWVYVICNFSLNKISRISILSDTSKIICTVFPEVKCCCLALNTTYSAIMNSFFEHHKLLLFRFHAEQKGQENVKKRLKQE